MAAFFTIKFILLSPQTKRMLHRYLQLPSLAIIADDYVSIFLPLTVGWICWKSVSKPMRLFRALFTYYFFSWLAHLYLMTLYTDDLWLAYITTVVEYCITALAFSLWNKNRFVQKVMKASIPVVLNDFTSCRVSF